MSLDGEEPKLIKNWTELAGCYSETHYLELYPDMGFGWIYAKNVVDGMGYCDMIRYLSTHTFYGPNYEHSTRILQECGFNVELSNWDDPET